MTSLYRKWRSKSFDELVGQEHVVRTLRNAVRQERIAHAYLFTGPRGTGKTSTARILSRAANCLSPRDGNPCNECDMCVASNEGRAYDIIEIDAASNTSVENVRELRERVGYASAEGRYKVYIIDEVHRLSGAAFDAFLKTLEEPPPHVIFVFASTEPHKVPATIVSRCQRFDFKRIPVSETLTHLRQVSEEEQIQITDEALQLLAQNANGSLRDALGLLDQLAAYAEGPIGDGEVRAALGLADPMLVDRLAEHLLSGELGSGLQELNTFVSQGGDAGQLTRQFVDFWRTVLAEITGAKAAEAGLDPALRDSVLERARQANEEQTLKVLQAFTETEVSPRFNLPQSLPFEISYLRASVELGQGAESVAAPVVEPSQNISPKVDAEPVAAEPLSEAIESPPEMVPPKPMVEAIGSPAETVPSEEEPPVESEPSEVVATSGPQEKAEVGTGEIWTSIVANMRAKSPSLQAVLRSGQILNIKDGEVTVGFLYDFHRDQFADMKRRKLLEEVVEETLGSRYRVVCIRTSKEELEAARGPERTEPDDGFVQELADRFRQFHAQQELGHSRS